MFAPLLVVRDADGADLERTIDEAVDNPGLEAFAIPADDPWPSA
jgi:hypothetical protein